MDAFRTTFGTVLRFDLHDFQTVPEVVENSRIDRRARLKKGSICPRFRSHDVGGVNEILHQDVHTSSFLQYFRRGGGKVPVLGTRSLVRVLFAEHIDFPRVWAIPRSQPPRT